MAKTKNALILPGGGIKGYITSLMLEHLDNLTPGADITDAFDMIAGTSTGSIIAGALGAGMQPKTIRELFEKEGPKIFANPRWKLVRLRNPKYRIEPLAESLLKYDLDIQFTEMKKPTMLFAAGLKPVKPVVYKSWKSEIQDGPLHKYIMASCAAPTYYPAVNGDVDGGVWANDPGIETYAELKRLDQQCHPQLLTLGTGYRHDPAQPDSFFKGNGILHWGASIVSYMLSLQAQRTNYVMKYALADNYWRFDFELRPGLDRMDAADRDSMSEMRDITLNYIQMSRDTFNRAAQTFWKDGAV